MADIDTENKCFTFVWKLENLSYCLQKKGTRIESPAFIVDAIQNTKWRLRLFPRGNREQNYIACYLIREADSDGAEKVEIEFELGFIAKDGSALIPKTLYKRAFPKDEDYGHDAFMRQRDIYISRRSEFLSQDTLIVRCRMWKIDGKMKESVLCRALTRIGVEKRSFRWDITNFSSLTSGENCAYQIKSMENEASLMSVNLSFTEGLSSNEFIRFELSLNDRIIKFCTMQLALIDAFRNRVECNQDEFCFENSAEKKQFTFSLTKKKLLAKKNMYLPNDVLSLLFEFTFSKGVVLEETEEVQCDFPRSIKDRTADNQSNTDKKKVLLSDIWNDNLKHLFDKQAFSDVKLKTKTKLFPAHKIILGASSSVFNTMFTIDMKEKTSDVVDIEDLSDDTINGMLLYIYTGRVEDLSWESATQLYIAADKYEIVNLKSLCSSYLKSNLSPRKACEVLLLSDLHADCDFKSAVQDYILQHIEEIVILEEWKFLMESSGKLAAETVCLQYL